MLLLNTWRRLRFLSDLRLPFQLGDRKNSEIQPTKLQSENNEIGNTKNISNKLDIYESQSSENESLTQAYLSAYNRLITDHQKFVFLNKYHNILIDNCSLTNYQTFLKIYNNSVKCGQAIESIYSTGIKLDLNSSTIISVLRLASKCPPSKPQHTDLIYLALEQLDKEIHFLLSISGDKNIYINKSNKNPIINIEDKEKDIILSGNFIHPIKASYVLRLWEAILFSGIPLFSVNFRSEKLFNIHKTIEPIFQAVHIPELLKPLKSLHIILTTIQNKLEIQQPNNVLFPFANNDIKYITSKIIRTLIDKAHTQNEQIDYRRLDILFDLMNILDYQETSSIAKKISKKSLIYSPVSSLIKISQLALRKSSSDLTQYLDIKHLLLRGLDYHKKNISSSILLQIIKEAPAITEVAKISLDAINTDNEDILNLAIHSLKHCSHPFYTSRHLLDAAKSFKNFQNSYKLSNSERYEDKSDIFNKNSIVLNEEITITQVIQILEHISKAFLYTNKYTTEFWLPLIIKNLNVYLKKLLESPEKSVLLMDTNQNTYTTESYWIGWPRSFLYTSEKSQALCILNSLFTIISSASRVLSYSTVITSLKSYFNFRLLLLSHIKPDEVRKACSIDEELLLLIPAEIEIPPLLLKHWISVAIYPTYILNQSINKNNKFCYIENSKKTISTNLYLENSNLDSNKHIEENVSSQIYDTDKNISKKLEVNDHRNIINNMKSKFLYPLYGSSLLIPVPSSRIKDIIQMRSKEHSNDTFYNIEEQLVNKSDISVSHNIINELINSNILLKNDFSETRKLSICSKILYKVLTDIDLNSPKSSIQLVALSILSNTSIWPRLEPLPRPTEKLVSSFTSMHQSDLLRYFLIAQVRPRYFPKTEIRTLVDSLLSTRYLSQVEPWSYTSWHTLRQHLAIEQLGLSSAAMLLEYSIFLSSFTLQFLIRNLSNQYLSGSIPSSRTGQVWTFHRRLQAKNLPAITRFLAEHDSSKSRYQKESLFVSAMLQLSSIPEHFKIRIYSELHHMPNYQNILYKKYRIFNENYIKKNFPNLSISPSGKVKLSQNNIIHDTIQHKSYLNSNESLNLVHKKYLDSENITNISSLVTDKITDIQTSKTENNEISKNHSLIKTSSNKVSLNPRNVLFRSLNLNMDSSLESLDLDTILDVLILIPYISLDKLEKVTKSVWDRIAPSSKIRLVAMTFSLSGKFFDHFKISIMSDIVNAIRDRRTNLSDLLSSSILAIEYLTNKSSNNLIEAVVFMNAVLKFTTQQKKISILDRSYAIILASYIIENSTNKIKDRALQHMNLIKLIPLSSKNTILSWHNPLILINYTLCFTKKYPNSDFLAIYITSTILDHLNHSELLSALPLLEYTREVELKQKKQKINWGLYTDFFLKAIENGAGAPLIRLLIKIPEVNKTLTKAHLKTLLPYERI